MGASQRRKGAAFERRVVFDLKEAGFEAKRNLDQYQQSDGRDITLDAPLCIQCKVGANPRWKAALREAEASAGTDYPIAVTHEDRGYTVVHMNWHDFIEILALPDVRYALRKNGP